MGLANSGKSSIVRRLCPEAGALQEELAPTVGFAVEQVDCQRSRLTVVDCSGQQKYVELWEHFFGDAQVGGHELMSGMHGRAPGAKHERAEQGAAAWTACGSRQR